MTDPSPWWDSDAETFRQTVARFARERLAPSYQQEDRDGKFRPGLVGELAAAGLLGLAVPAEYGGQDAGAVATGLALAEVAYADLNAAYLVLLSVLCSEIIAATGAAQAGVWLTDIASGAALPCLALTEPGHGSDAAALRLRADREGNGWRLTGEKTSVSLGLLASTAVVFARTGGTGAAGISAFYVDLDDRYVTRSGFSDLGSRAVGRAALRFEAMPAGPERLLGTPGDAFGRVMRGFNYSRALIGLMCLAAAQASLDGALVWARERTAFGRPIGTFEGVAFPLAEDATRLHAARLLCLEALWRKDNGLDPALSANMAKWWAPQVAVAAAHQALLVHGHAGYSEELPFAQRVRDLIGLEIGDGTAQIAKLVVARHLLGRDTAP